MYTVHFVVHTYMASYTEKCVTNFGHSLPFTSFFACCFHSNLQAFATGLVPYFFSLLLLYFSLSCVFPFQTKNLNQRVYNFVCVYVCVCVHVYVRACFHAICQLLWLYIASLISWKLFVTLFVSISTEFYMHHCSHAIITLTMMQISRMHPYHCSNGALISWNWLKYNRQFHWSETVPGVVCVCVSNCTLHTPRWHL